MLLLGRTTPMPLLEVCVDSLPALEAAQSKGAQRIELCSRLDDGGLTPDAALVLDARRRARLPVHAMVRPRAGDYVYSQAEFAAMLATVDELKPLGFPGVALGVLDRERRIDRARLAALVERARPMSVTFHRAFDEVVDPLGELEALIELGVERVLTSGGRPSAFEGRHRLRELVERAAGRIIVVAAGGVRAHNVRELVDATAVAEVHSSTWFQLDRVLA